MITKNIKLNSICWKLGHLFEIDVGTSHRASGLIFYWVKHWFHCKKITETNQQRKIFNSIPQCCTFYKLQSDPSVSSCERWEILLCRIVEWRLPVWETWSLLSPTGRVLRTHRNWTVGNYQNYYHGLTSPHILVQICHGLSEVRSQVEGVFARLGKGEEEVVLLTKPEENVLQGSVVLPVLWVVANIIFLLSWHWWVWDWRLLVNWSSTTRRTVRLRQQRRRKQRRNVRLSFILSSEVTQSHSPSDNIFRKILHSSRNVRIKQ